jgi:hypothetical protein
MVVRVRDEEERHSRVLSHWCGRVAETWCGTLCRFVDASLHATGIILRPGVDGMMRGARRAIEEFAEKSLQEITEEVAKI